MREAAQRRRIRSSQLIAYAIALVPAVCLWIVRPGMAHAWSPRRPCNLVTFELHHALYHLPAHRVPLGGRFRWLRRNHELLHYPASMQRYSFNLTCRSGISSSVRISVASPVP
jgi:hypothetical protein